MAKVERNLEMTVPHQALFEAITDFEGYPKFLPEVVGAKILSREGAKTRVQFEIEVVKKFVYVLEFEVKGKEEIRWHLVESNFFKTNEGQWKISPASDKSTNVSYSLTVDFGFMVPGFVSKKLTEVSLPKMFENFETQARSKGKS